MKPILHRLEAGKLYYAISEVCRITGLEPHVLRYWETEFPQMRPRKNRSGNRAYRAKEIQYIHYIRYLLQDEKYTIRGAKKKLSEVGPEEIAGQVSLIPPIMLAAKTPAAASAPWRGELERIRAELHDVLRLLQ